MENRGISDGQHHHDVDEDDFKALQAAFEDPEMFSSIGNEADKDGSSDNQYGVLPLAARQKSMSKSRIGTSYVPSERQYTDHDDHDTSHNYETVNNSITSSEAAFDQNSSTDHHTVEGIPRGHSSTDVKMIAGLPKSSSSSDLLKLCDEKEEADVVTVHSLPLQERVMFKKP
jgi:hypothetical protein